MILVEGIWGDSGQLTKQKQTKKSDKSETGSRPFPMKGLMACKFCQCLGTDIAFFIRTVHLLLAKLLAFMYVHKCLQALKVSGTACTAECLHHHLASCLHIKLGL